MRIGILGSGLMGGALGPLFARAGHDVVFSYARSARKLDRLAREAAGQARVASRGDRRDEVRGGLPAGAPSLPSSRCRRSGRRSTRRRQRTRSAWRNRGSGCGRPRRTRRYRRTVSATAGTSSTRRTRRVTGAERSVPSVGGETAGGSQRLRFECRRQDIETVIPFRWSAGYTSSCDAIRQFAHVTID